MAERIFNRMPRALYRRRISRAEVGAGVAVLGALGLAGAWLAAQGPNFDPAERDVSFAVLSEQSVADRLYQRPLLRWREPGQAAPSATVDLGAFPAPVLEGPWQLNGRLRQFGPDTLYEKINGAAEQFLRFGFQRLHYVDLKHNGGPEGIGIELYDQGDFSGALGIFSAQRDPARTVQREGALHYYETGIGAIGVMGPWYVRIAGSAETPAVQAKARQLVTAFAGLPVDAQARPFGFTVLTEGLGLPLEQVAYQAANVFQFEFARDFWFGAVPGTKAARMFVHRAADGAAAAELYERLLGEQRYDFDVVQEQEERAVLRHKFLGNLFVVAQEGALVYGIENAPDERQALAATERLAESLRRMPGANN